MADKPTEDRTVLDERFVRLFAKNESSLRAYVRSLLPTWEAVDEVLQETSLVLWRKMDQFDPDTEFIRWACVVARFEALRYRRKKARDRHVFNEDLLDLMATEAEEEVRDLELERRALATCMAKVNESHRKYLVAVHAEGSRIKDVAERAGITATKLYKLLSRLRVKLLDCMTWEMKKETS